MAIFYLDLVNGNDANDGTTWANAWKTFQLGATAARIAPGDEIRVAKSPDPELVGTASWNGDVITGDDIVFDTAPTQFITDGTAGWTTMGGPTVTNNQSTAWVVGRAATGGGVSVAAASNQSLMYKNLGSTIDFSANTQISFWFRPSAAFDCSTSQNMYIRLCSDTAGITVVDTLTMPKWNYNSSYWYPIVIDKGSALGSNIQSISITQTTSTALTYYFDEFFASPSGGLTLWSLIGKHTSNTNESKDWFPIKAIKNNIVTIFHGPNMSTAAGAATSPTFCHKATALCQTENVNTFKRETLKPYQGSTTGPQGTVYGIYITDSGTVNDTTYNPIYYTGGWNTSTTTVDGYTWIDNLIQLGTAQPTSSQGIDWEVGNFGFARFNNGLYVSGSKRVNNGCSFVSIVQTPDAVGSASVTNTFLPVNKRIYNCDSIISCSGQLTIVPAVGSTPAFVDGVITLGNIRCAGSSGPIYFGNGSNKLSINAGDLIFYGFQTSQLSSINQVSLTARSIQTARSNQNSNPQSPVNFSNSSQCFFNVGTINNIIVGNNNSVNRSCTDVLLKIDNFIGNSVIAPADGLTIKIGNYASNASTLFYVGWSNPNTKTYLMDFNGVVGDSRILIGAPSTYPGYCQLSGVDVHTPGSKAWTYTGPNPSTDFMLNIEHTFKLASCAAEANKLVTVTCYIKSNGTTNDVGIRIPMKFGMVSGYTTDINSFVTTSGSWEQVTITFTPTANCVFDVEAVAITKTTSLIISSQWDDLTITQAA